MSKVLEEIMVSTNIIPVLVIEHLEDAVPLAEALVRGGLNVLEITLRTAVAAEALTLIKNHLPEVIVGMGTVIDPISLEVSLHAGADFLVSPGTTPELLEASKLNQAALLPGAATPTEAMALFDQGYRLQKFFPAEAAGGVAMLKSIYGPLPQINFCPTGGINATNAVDYLACSNVTCIGGSWMANKSWVKNKDWKSIEDASREAVTLTTKSSTNN